jgi:hypothetical protein
MSRVKIPDSVKSHPDYADGYYAAFSGERFDLERADSEEYAYGFEAGEQAVATLKDAGFRRSNGGFGVVFPITGGRA